LESSKTENEKPKVSFKKPSLINNSGFNIDEKKYIPLNILIYLFFPPLIIFVIISSFLIPTFILTLNIVNNINKLLLVQNYIFGQLIISSINTIELKCFISDCQNKTYLNPYGLVNMDLMEDILNGINIFTEISTFYHKKYLFNACEVVIDPEKDPEKYQKCLKDPIIIKSNNTDNLIELIGIYAYNLQKEYEMEMNMNSDFYKKNLFNSSYFKNIESIYYLYLYKVGDNFADIVCNNLEDYLRQKK
jgi:hypothetical protein